MTFSVALDTVPVGEYRYFDTGFRRIIEDHLVILRIESADEVEVKHNGVKYIHDFYGLLLSLGVKQDLWWITMRLNGYGNPNEFTNDRLTIQLPNQEKVRELFNRYKTIKK